MLHSLSVHLSHLPKLSGYYQQKTHLRNFLEHMLSFLRIIPQRMSVIENSSQWDCHPRNQIHPCLSKESTWRSHGNLEDKINVCWVRWRRQNKVP
jgi:hypothetical protein